MGGSIVDYFSGVWKPLCKDGGLDVGYMVNADTIWRLNNTQVNIGELWNFFGGFREVLGDPSKEVLKEVGTLVGT